MLMNISQKMSIVMPVAISFPRKSFEFNAIFKPHRTSVRNMIIRINAPTKPHSSAKTEKTKSVCCSGRNFNCVCVPRKNPFPMIPPDPTAMMDWMMWYPAPRGSCSGSKKVMIRSFW